MDSFSFNTFNKYAPLGIGEAIKNFNKSGKRLVFVCIGSDLVLGDSLGPLSGTFIKNKEIGSFVYGTLNFPITAKEIPYVQSHLKRFHPDCLCVAIDAAVGDSEDVGLIKVVNSSLKPGLGVQKKLGAVGDISIIGVVAGKSAQNYDLFNLTRLNLIYKMSEVIADGIKNFFDSNPASSAQNN
ncbi:MAG: spore protease YyaC [Clostridia bacterium]|nr:spore protease YyaC [Clostridia bacterium]